ncbi:MAG: NADP-reducing hydrogenase subunit HndC [Verrucomicrobia subdivision 3 bacterium]|nr:NADP-reducing hydrogenase subunit HndC [Limisphaerales bacterium]MCS1415764.1 NADP-reducing hydrogenase subunit HndC [Limisphaerales bacterium]
MDTQATNQSIIDQWKQEPAPLLSVLHAFHDRDGHLSEPVIRDIAAGLKIPLAELYGTITFYHHLSQEPPGQSAPRVCAGPVCYLKGSAQLLASLADLGASTMACAGRCDDPIPVLKGHRALVGNAAGALAERPAPLPVPNPGNVEECIFAKIREPNRATISGYRDSGGYAAMDKILATHSPGDVITLISESKLAGRGGAGFPTGTKWKAVAEAPGEPKTVVCNADEGEPGCFKDRAVLDYDPHAVIEGMLIAAYAAGATQGFLYLRYEYPRTLGLLQQAIDEAYSAGYLGDHSGEKDIHFDLYLRRGAGAYICGEEGSLLNSLEGKHPFPRNRPPFPVTHGYHDRPTVVNNVETLAAVPQIVLKGADWYRGLGLNDHAGTKVISLSGDIRRSGNYEVPLGLPLRTLLYDWAGGPPDGNSIQAVTMAGLSGGYLAGDDLEVTLDDPSIRSKGSFLGAGGIIVYDNTRNMVAAAHEAMAFFAEESCGKCFPCRIGTERLTEYLAGQTGSKDLEAWNLEVDDMGMTMMAASACGLGMAAPNITKSLAKYFPDQITKHVQNRS